MKLIIPESAYVQAYADAVCEYTENDVKSYEFKYDAENDISVQFENSHSETSLPTGYVPSTNLWLVEGNEFLGEVSIRHHLTERLLRFGGNIGYGIRYSRWNEGLGTGILSMALDYAKETLALEKVLITCNDLNTGSARVIEKNGGVLQDKITNTLNGKEILTRRYWITL